MKTKLKVSMITVCVLFLLLGAIGCQAEKCIDCIDELLKGTRNAITLANEISKLERTPSNLQLLKDLWDEREDLYPDFLWHQLRYDIVKTEIAFVLAQSHRHCEIKADMDAMREFMLKQIKSDSVMISSGAVARLGAFGYEEDIPLLISIVKNEKKGFAEEAVWSLRAIHKQSIFDALKKILPSIKRESLRQEIQEILNEQKGFRGLVEMDCELDKTPWDAIERLEREKQHE